MTKITTIGFSKKSLEKFLRLISDASVTKVIDTRLNNTSQLSGFSKKDDLKFILEEFSNIKYVHRLDLAPSKEILDDYKNKRIEWNEYEEKYIFLLESRKINEIIDDLMIDGEVVCFLCSEDKPHRCHRSILAEYIKSYKSNVEIIHLL